MPHFTTLPPVHALMLAQTCTSADGSNSAAAWLFGAAVVIGGFMAMGAVVFGLIEFFDWIERARRRRRAEAHCDAARR